MHEREVSVLCQENDWGLSYYVNRYPRRRRQKEPLALRNPIKNKRTIQIEPTRVPRGVKRTRKDGRKGDAECRARRLRIGRLF
jgi:hypothetical protein